MNTTTLLITINLNSDAGEEIDHLYCCDTKVALCGTDLSASFEVFTPIPEDKLCIVCDDLVEAPCRICGKAL